MAERFQGVDVSDPSNVTARGRAFDVPGGFIVPPSDDTRVSDDLIYMETLYLEHQSVLEQARSLSIHMKASYGAYSGAAAYNYCYERKDTHRRIIAIGRQTLQRYEPPAPVLEWSRAPRSEGIEDDDERLRQFVDDYGTHYLSSITYGFKYVIHGEFDATKEYERTSASLKAACSAWQAEGRADYETMRRLSEEYTKIEANITAGRAVRVVDGKERPAEVVQLRSLEEVAAFFQDLKSDTLRLYVGPIQAEAVSYWHTLPSDLYPKTRKILEPPDRLVTDALYGVPRGTIVAWHPTQAHHKPADDGKVTYDVPEGWAVCDGRDLGNGRSAPDLRDKFIYGTANLEDVGSLDGAATHDHTGEALHHADRWLAPRGEIGKTGSDHAHRHPLRIQEASHLPPLVRMMFIIKL